MQIGGLAPDFTLPLHTGEEFRLSDYRGKKNVVLYFYPRDFTQGCTKEGCLFSSHIKEIERLGAVIIGISADPVELHKKFVSKYGLAFPLASDIHKTVCRQYEALWFLAIAIRRVTYIIDKEGIICGRTRHELHIDSHWEYVLHTLRELERTNNGPNSARA